MFEKRILSLKNELRFPIIFLLNSCIFFSICVSTVESKTLEEIENEIESKESTLEELENDLEEAKNLAGYYESKATTSSSELERVENELKQIEAEMDINQAEIKKYEQELEIYQLEFEQSESVMNDKMIDLYIYNKQGIVDIFIENGEVDDFWKDYNYREKLLDVDLESISNLAKEVSGIERERNNVIQSLAVLQENNESLVSKKEELSSQVSYYTSLSSYNEGRQSGIRAQMGTVQQDLEGLTAEQQQMLQQEMDIIAGANGGTQPLESGEFYFWGRGRSVYQGHGLGFSQYGAKGGAEKGMTAQQIAVFYYPGSYIGNHVDEAVEDRISYLGEIPDYACGTAEQAAARPDKYRVDNSNTIWDCWPEESIKAQIIVSRSYAYTGGTDQVYKSTNVKKWAVDETRGQVLKHSTSGYRDQVIKAFFSADNNNGWGTATHKNPVFCSDFNGNCGAGFSWLQAVNDSSFAAKGPYTDWTWRTNSYSMSEMQSMFEWYANSGFVYPKSSDVRNMLNQIGTLQSFQIERDVSGRAARVLVKGNNGSVQVNGDFFKRIFIFWVYNVKPSGEVDPIFSLTYYFRQVP